MYHLETFELRRRLVPRLIVSAISAALFFGAAAGYTVRGWGETPAAAAPAQAPALGVNCDRPGSDGLFDCQVTDYVSAQATAFAHCAAPAAGDVAQTFSCEFPALNVMASVDSQCSPLEVRAWSFGMLTGSGECDVPLRRAILETINA